GDDPGAGLGQEPRGRLANVPEALNRYPGAAEIQPQHLGGLLHAVDEAATGGILAAFRAADGDRLARHDARHRVALVHRDRVHDPGHRLSIGVQVRGRDVAFRTDQDRDLGGVPPRQALQLTQRELLRLADDAALGATVRDPDDGAL